MFQIREDRSGWVGRTFYKMTGSGNDFVFFDCRSEPAGGLEHPGAIQRLTARGVGIGADGVVFLDSSNVADVKMTYYNADGSLASLCGNATLCTTRLAAELGVGGKAGLKIETDAGVISARVREGLPEIDLDPVTQVDSDYSAIEKLHGERRLGFALVGVPHIVLEVDDNEAADVVGRGAEIRHHPSLPDGANVNFLSRGPDGVWKIRTYERGVEGETLACGTGSVAAGILLASWGLIGSEVELITRSGQPLFVTPRPNGDPAKDVWNPSLRGEGRIVFQGQLSEIG